MAKKLQNPFATKIIYGVVITGTIIVPILLYLALKYQNEITSGLKQYINPASYIPPVYYATLFIIATLFVYAVIKHIINLRARNNYFKSNGVIAWGQLTKRQEIPTEDGPPAIEWTITSPSGSTGIFTFPESNGSKLGNYIEIVYDPKDPQDFKIHKRNGKIVFKHEK